MPAPYYDPTWNTWTTSYSSTVLVSNTDWGNLGYVGRNNSIVWNTWSSTPVTVTYTITESTPEPETDEQWAAREAEVERLRELNLQRRMERDARRNNAQTHARALLRSVLSQEQWDTWEAGHFIEVQGSEGNWFRLIPGYSGNITVFDEQGDIERICAHPNLYDRRGDPLPNEDVLAAQILALKTNEINFRRIANVHRRFRAETDDELTAA